MLSFEEKFRAIYPHYSVQEERVSSALTRYRVVVNGIPCSESGIRDLAFKYALEDIRDGRLNIPESQQIELWPLRA